MTAAGEVEFASIGATDLLTTRRRDALRRAVRRLDSGDVSQCFQFIGDLEVRLTRMEGGGVFHYLAILSPPSSACLDPVVGLTPTQRKIVEYAAAGATNEEIASTMSRSPHTIKTHFKAIYGRLDVANRIELAELVNGLPKLRPGFRQSSEGVVGSHQISNNTNLQSSPGDRVCDGMRRVGPCICDGMRRDPRVSFCWRKTSTTRLQIGTALP